MVKIAQGPLYNHPLPLGHRFPMGKYDLIPTQLKREGIFDEDHFFIPDEMDHALIERVHSIEYIRALQKGTLERLHERRIGFPYSPRLLDRELNITFGTVQAAAFALEQGCSFNIAGGTHHAYRDRGEGFCLYNDIAVASQYLLDKGLVKQILVVDLDVHQGNGTASIFQNESRVFTFSMHGEKNYPFKKEQSDLDIPLANGTQDNEYLDILEEQLPKLIDMVQPDFIFYQAGVDILETDKLGKLSVSRIGCKQRDEIVFGLASHYQIPTTTVMGGGYSPDIMDVVEAHCGTYQAAKDIYGF